MEFPTAAWLPQGVAVAAWLPLRNQAVLDWAARGLLDQVKGLSSPVFCFE